MEEFENNEEEATRGPLHSENSEVEDDKRRHDEDPLPAGNSVETKNFKLRKQEANEVQRHRTVAGAHLFGPVASPSPRLLLPPTGFGPQPPALKVLKALRLNPTQRF